MRSRALAVALLALLALPVRAELVERVVAVLDGRPILLSDVRVLARVRGVSLEAARGALIDERLMYREAARLGGTAPGAEDEDRALADLHARAGLDDVPDDALRRLLRRQATILRYVDLRFRPQIRVDDEAVREAWPERRPDRPFVEVADELRTRLFREALDARLEDWVAELRAGALVRLLGDVEDPAGATLPTAASSE
jgi:hypothetical protein